MADSERLPVTKAARGYEPIDKATRLRKAPVPSPSKGPYDVHDLLEGSLSYDLLNMMLPLALVAYGVYVATVHWDLGGLLDTQHEL